jgi:hypothetical protein
VAGDLSVHDDGWIGDLHLVEEVGWSGRGGGPGGGATLSIDRWWGKHCTNSRSNGRDVGEIDCRNDRDSHFSIIVVPRSPHLFRRILSNGRISPTHNVIVQVCIYQIAEGSQRL